MSQTYTEGCINEICKRQFREGSRKLYSVESWVCSTNIYQLKQKDHAKSWTHSSFKPKHMKYNQT